MITEKTVRLYTLGNYTFGTKVAPAGDDEGSARQSLKRLESRYHEEGMCRSVEGVLIVHEHGHPHVLLLQSEDNEFQLPGGVLKPGEDDKEGLLRKLQDSLGTDNQTQNWKVDDLLCTWWRPNFEKFMYPYLPPHVTKPKECSKQFLVTLPEKCAFRVTQNLQIIAIPLFELFDNHIRYGHPIAGLPQLLGRLSFVPL
mmetsp:Transcript_4151/g.11592  ORF Transcript_4151/g.11592 Transcript_4151/m.11592 type:complete len:198 (+) Transcript_4151:150-743(+)